MSGRQFGSDPKGNPDYNVLSGWVVIPFIYCIFGVQIVPTADYSVYLYQEIKQRPLQGECRTQTVEVFCVYNNIMKRDFKGVWIPKDVWLSKDLTVQEKLFYVEINSLDNEKGCFANNHYFAEFFDISKQRVSIVIKSLIDKGYIKSTIIYKEGTKQIVYRVLNICKIPSPIIQGKPSHTKQGEGTIEMFKDSNTVNNTSTNNTDKVYSKEIHDSYDKCILYFPEHLRPNNEKKKNQWLDTIDKLERVDKIPFEIIENVVMKTRADEFWSKNFLSLTKLRKKNRDDVMYIVAFNEQIKNIGPADNNQMSEKEFYNSFN